MKHTSRTPHCVIRVPAKRVVPLVSMESMHSPRMKVLDEQFVVMAEGPLRSVDRDRYRFEEPVKQAGVAKFVYLYDLKDFMLAFDLDDPNCQLELERRAMYTWNTVCLIFYPKRGDPNGTGLEQRGDEDANHST